MKMKIGTINSQSLEIEQYRHKLFKEQKVKVVAIVEDEACVDGEGYLVLYRHLTDGLMSMIVDKDLIDLEEELTKISFE